MRRPNRFVTGLAAFGVVACTANTPRQGVTRDVAEHIRNQVRILGQAYRDSDVDAVDALIAKDYVHTNGGNPPGSRASYLAWNRTRAERLRQGRWRLDKYEVSELQVSLLGTVAVVTGRVAAKGARDGRPWSSDIRFTQLWTEEDGVWRRAAFHDAAVTNPESS